jgi:hypothetical protein
MACAGVRSPSAGCGRANHHAHCQSSKTVPSTASTAATQGSGSRPGSSNWKRGNQVCDCQPKPTTQRSVRQREHAAVEAALALEQGDHFIGVRQATAAAVGGEQGQESLVRTRSNGTDIVRREGRQNMLRRRVVAALGSDVGDLGNLHETFSKWRRRALGTTESAR